MVDDQTKWFTYHTLPELIFIVWQIAPTKKKSIFNNGDMLEFLCILRQVL